MDSLLATYASDDDEEENHVEEKKPSPSKPSLFNRLPPPRNPTFSSLPPPRSLVKSEEVNSSGEDLPKRSSLFSKLPAPKVKAEAGVEVKVKKQVVAFKPPIDLAALADDDDDWRPAQKRVKAEVKSVASGGGLSALLPAPKNSLGSGSALGSGGRRAAMDVFATRTTEPVKAERAAPVYDNAAYAVSSSEVEAEPAAVYDNAAYAVDEIAAFPPQTAYSNEAYGWAAPAEEIPQSMDNPNSQYEQYHADNASYDPNEASYDPSEVSYEPAPVIDPLARVLQAQRHRGRQDKMAPPTVIEVKQADLTGGRLREDKLRPTGIAFGPSYKPPSGSKDKATKLQRRKHQIGTLLADVKSREMEFMDRRARGSLTKAETQAKYGW